ncbi:MAG: hypothetical protein NZ554_07960 [Bryobacteraceae bacterium]|nr:hypothetical protein [Bryobacteraceae bacterium]
MLGHPLPSPEAARKFLYQFHEEQKRAQAQQELPSGQLGYVPEESAPLRAVAQVNEDLVPELARRCTALPGWLSDERRECGPEGSIGFGLSADESRPATLWRPRGLVPAGGDQATTCWWP